MGINSFAEALEAFKEHKGHSIDIQAYGFQGGGPIVNVTIGCETCYTVLHEWDISDQAILVEHKPAAEAPQSREAWNAYNNLHDAARLIESTCAWAEKDEAVYDRLADFVWNTIDAPLEEVASELRRSAEFIVGKRESKVDINEILSVVPEPWEAEESLCGYSAWCMDDEVIRCYHKGCYEEQADIVAALEAFQAIDVLSAALDSVAVDNLRQVIRESLLGNFEHEDGEEELPHEHTILVAFDMMENTREGAQLILIDALVNNLNPVMNDLGIESWWVAEDDRMDGSDNDSAVFVPYGDQASFSMQAMRETCLNWRNKGYEQGVMDALASQKVEDMAAQYDAGYQALAKQLNEWVDWWQKFQANDLGHLTEEQIARVASVYDHGGSFEEFIIRELFFINEGE